MVSISKRLILLFAIIAFSLIPASAQELVKSSTKTVSDTTETNVAERVRLLERELEKQNSKLDLLQRTLEEQQQTIQALLEKLSATTTATTTPAKETEAPAAVATTTAVAPEPEPQTPTVEQRLAKVEGQALKIGPVRVSGDFRLRCAGTFRSATEPPDPPLDHVQNARARYRLRLNFYTDIYPNLSFHAQLATGPLNSPLSTNQDFTSLTVRAPFALSEAWIDYRPTKSIHASFRKKGART